MAEPALPYDLVNGADADAVQLMANLNYLLGLITSGAAPAFPPSATFPANPSPGQGITYTGGAVELFYIYGEDGLWHVLAQNS